MWFRSTLTGNGLLIVDSKAGDRNEWSLKEGGGRY